MDYIETKKEQAVFELVRLLKITDEELDQAAQKASSMAFKDPVFGPSGSGRVELIEAIQSWVKAIKEVNKHLARSS